MGHFSNKFISQLASKRLALFLFLGLAVFLIPETFNKAVIPFFTPVKFFILSLIWLNLAFCTLQHFSRLRKSVLLIHCGCLITIIGSLAGHFGYVATINIHEGNSSSTAYRWDKEKDTPLGFELTTEKINREYYPVMVKVGVLENGQKAGLFQLKTGESFTFKDHIIEVESLDPVAKSLLIGVYFNDQLVTHFDTKKAVAKNDIPFDFKLVAFQNPVLKRIWVDMSITAQGEKISGIAEVNNPFIWKGIRFFNTANGVDPNGFPYAGIQIVRDPGIPIVYFGFVVLTLGCLFLLPSLFRKKQRNG